jgi:hypothetical protein
VGFAAATQRAGGRLGWAGACVNCGFWRGFNPICPVRPRPRHPVDRQGPQLARSDATALGPKLSPICASLLQPPVLPASPLGQSPLPLQPSAKRTGEKSPFCTGAKLPFIHLPGATPADVFCWANPASRDRVLGAPACRPLRPETPAGQRGLGQYPARHRPASASALRVTPPFRLGWRRFIAPAPRMRIAERRRPTPPAPRRSQPGRRRRGAQTPLHHRKFSLAGLER